MGARQRHGICPMGVSSLNEGESKDQANTDRARERRERCGVDKQLHTCSMGKIFFTIVEHFTLWDFSNHIIKELTDVVITLD